MLGRDLQRLEYGWPVGMPLVRSLGAGLHELRSNLTGGRTARVILVVGDQRLVLLHGFLKKTRATPREALVLARSRKHLWEIDHA